MCVKLSRFYWWFVFIYGNAGGTYPYTSKYLKYVEFLCNDNKKVIYNEKGFGF